MDRRTCLNLIGRSAVVTWIGSMFGSFRGRQSLNTINEAAVKPEELDAYHRGRREQFESRQNATTATAAIVGLTLVSGSIKGDVGVANLEDKIDSELERVPVDLRDPNLRDIGRANQQHTRRQMLAQVGAALGIAGVGGPVVTALSKYVGGPVVKRLTSIEPNPANLVHGAPVKDENPIVTQHRAITEARQDLRNTTLNSALLGGLVMATKRDADDAAFAHSKSIQAGKFKIQELFNKSPNEIKFTADVVELGENLIAMLPASLNDSNNRLEVTVKNSLGTKTTILDYVDRGDNPGFYERTMSGSTVNNPILLNYGDEVTVQVHKLRSEPSKQV